MPFIRVTEVKTKQVNDINVNRIISFYERTGDKFTTIHLEGGLDLHVEDEPRQLRGYIKKAEGTLPVKKESNAEIIMHPVFGDPATSR